MAWDRFLAAAVCHPMADTKASRDEQADDATRASASVNSRRHSSVTAGAG